jgi:hypothetical protein
MHVKEVMLWQEPFRENPFRVNPQGERARRLKMNHELVFVSV